MDKSKLADAAERFPEYVREPFRDMMVCGNGAEAVFVLADLCGGSNIYVPNLRNLFGGCLLMGAAAGEYGGNAKEIADLCGYSVGYVRKALRKRGAVNEYL